MLKRFLSPNRACGYLLDTDVGLFVVGNDDMGVGRKLAKNGVYAQKELRMILSLVGQQDRVLVVGAHIGSLAIPIAKRVKEVVAIEANPRTYRLLEANIAINKLTNIQAFPVAANDKEGDLQFICNRSNSGISKRMPVKRAFRFFFDRPSIINVTARRLDDQFKGEKFDLILMDIEGSEYFALKGMPKLLSKARHLVIEFRPYHLKNVSGITLTSFLSTILPYFSMVTIPTKSTTLSGDEIFPDLEVMQQQGDFDDGIVFSKDIDTLSNID